MGDMSDLANQWIMEDEARAYEYTSGAMSREEAYDHGFIDDCGQEIEALEAIWDSTPIGTYEEINRSLREEELKLNLYLTKHTQSQPVSKSLLNAKATKNLYKELPTCNHCRESMTPQEGKFGKFYFCGNFCKDQKTVSDKYWQSVKK